MVIKPKFHIHSILNIGSQAKDLPAMKQCAVSLTLMAVKYREKNMVDNDNEKLKVLKLKDTHYNH